MSGKTTAYKKISNWEVLTPSGYRSFSGIKKVNKEYSLKFITEFNKEIICSGGHQLYVKRELEGQESEEMFCFADMIEPYTDKIKNKVGEYETVIDIEKIEKEIDLFDLVDVEDGYEYYANDLLSHNCAHIENFSELWTGLQPTISTGGSAILISTPLGIGNQFHSIWAKATDKNFDPTNIKTNEEGSNKFYAIELPWTVHPERDQEWYESQCSELGNDPRRISQELLCAFNSSGNNFIDSKIIEYLKIQLKTPIARYGNGNDMNIWEYAQPGHKYIISADVARGDADDFSAAWVIDADTNICVADFKSKIPPDRFAEFLVDIGNKYNNAFVVNEINSVGVATSYALKTLKYSNLYFEKLYNGSIENNYTQDTIGDLIPGFNTNVKSRNEIMTKFEAAIRNKEIQVYSERLIKELETFIWDGKKAKALKGYNDDLIMALAIGVNFINWGATRSTYDDGASILAMIQGMSKNSRTLEQLTKQQNNPNTVDWGNTGFDLPSKGSIYSNTNTQNNVYVGGARIPSWIKQT